MGINPDAISRPLNAALQHIPNPKLLADLFDLYRFPLYEKVEARLITNTPGTLKRAVMMESVIALQRNSCFGSSLIFTNGAP